MVLFSILLLIIVSGSRISVSLAKVSSDDTCIWSEGYCTCDKINYNVTCIRLKVSFEYLMGKLLPETVQHLNVQNNYMDQQINLNETCFKRINLISLELIRLNIVSVSQSTFRFCGILKVINLSKNRIRIIEPNTFPSKLIKLDLSHNRIIALLPNTFKSSPDIKYLDLQGNSFLYLPINFLRGLRTLKTFHISGGACVRSSCTRDERLHLQIICPETLQLVNAHEIFREDKKNLPEWLKCCGNPAVVTGVFGRLQNTSPCSLDSCSKSQNATNFARLNQINSCFNQQKHISHPNQPRVTLKTTHSPVTKSGSKNSATSKDDLCLQNGFWMKLANGKGLSTVFIFLAVVAPFALLMSLVFGICTFVLTIKQRNSKRNKKKQRSICVSTSDNDIRNKIQPKNLNQKFHSRPMRQNSAGTEVSWRDCKPNHCVRQNTSLLSPKKVYNVPNGRRSDLNSLRG